MKQAILILGPTGAGKSSVIAAASGQKGIVGHSVESCTQDIQAYDVALVCPNTEARQTVTLIDTRGFNDSSGLSDIHVLADLASYVARHARGSSSPRNVSLLASISVARDHNNAAAAAAMAPLSDASGDSDGLVICGVLFLHSIKETRFTGTAKANLELLKAIVGEAFYPRVVLATTMWNDLPPAAGAAEPACSPRPSAVGDKFEARHKELETRIWQDMILKGARCLRFDGSATSVHRMIQPLLAPRDGSSHPPPQSLLQPVSSLQLLRELAANDDRLISTSAGQVVAREARKRSERLHKRLLDAEDATERRKLEEMLRRGKQEMEVLHVNIVAPGIGAEAGPERQSPSEQPLLVSVRRIALIPDQLRFWLS
ncbi:hypothetical protein Neosp_000002 [[Neocosmospora] mangrovei]